MTDDPERILVLEAGGIGDAVMATPTLAALRARVPHARVTVVMAPRATTIVEALGRGLEVRTLRLGRPVAPWVDAAHLVLAEPPDLLIDLSSIESNGAALKRRVLVALIRARRSVGRNTDGRGPFFNAAIDESLGDPEHEVDRKLRVIGLLGIRAESARPVVTVSAAAADAARRMRADAGVPDDAELIGVHPGAFLPTRRWPVDRFARLAGKLAEERRAAVLVTGGPLERDLVEQVAAAPGGAVVRAAGLPLMHVAALIRRCRLFVTNDTGMMHLAAAQNVPVLALFGWSNARRYRPYLPPERCTLLQQPAEACPEIGPADRAVECRRTTCPSGACMTGIRYDDVLRAARELLDRTGDSAGGAA